MWRAEREDVLLIAVTRDGKIYVGNDWATTAELPGMIRERVAHSAERTAYIKADARARWGRVGEVWMRSDSPASDILDS